MAITFRVDAVDAVRSRLAAVSLEAAVAEALGVDPLQVSHSAQLVEEGRGVHPVVQAVHLAFAQHRALSLSPDHVWLCIAQGFATHVDKNAERLRGRFVRHDGRHPIVVTTDAKPGAAHSWEAVIAAFGDGIAEHVGAGTHRLLRCSFTTTTAVERAASDVVMMSAFRRYFDYLLYCICGIPEVTLEGEVGDWEDIRARVEVLAEYDLGWWASALRPVLDELVNTARGAPDRDFWQCIYKPVEAYGGDVATGWITRLFPYLEYPDGSTVQNPAVLSATEVSGRARWITEGVSPKSLPRGFSRAPVTVIEGDSKQHLSVYGGFAGALQRDDGALRPEVCWVVGTAPRMTALIERIVTEHRPNPWADRGDNVERPELPAALVELYDRCDGATLFGRWNISRSRDLHILIGSPTQGFLGIDPRAPLREGSYSPSESLPVLPLCTLADDPRFFGLYFGEGFCVVLCDPRVAQDVEDVVVVADDVTTFFERIFENDGAPWFEGQRGPSLYARLGPYHDHLRRAFAVGPHAPPTDLNKREKTRLVMLLSRHDGTVEQRSFWWESLRGATGTSRSYDELFGAAEGGRRRVPYEVMADLGLR